MFGYAMYSALYYPFTSPQNSAFLKTALFLWDNVDFIVPWQDFRPRGQNSTEEEALELIARPYVPTNRDKEAAHIELEQVCAAGLPDELRFELQDPRKSYDIYPQKLFDKTWRMLAESQLARSLNHDDQVYSAETGQTFAYYMMSILAVCCANGERRLITDQTDPYRTLYHLLADVGTEKPDANENWHGRLLALSFSGLDFTEIDLQRLVSLRRTEDSLLHELRRHFLDQIDSTAQQISGKEVSQRKIVDTLNEFSRKMETNLLELKRALRKNAKDMILSREFGLTVVALVSGLIGPAPAALLSAGGLTKALGDYKDRRRQLLKEHPSAWLFAATGSKLPVF